MANFVYNEMADVWEEPQVFMGLEMYPILMKDALYFYHCVECLMMRKNRETDLRFFGMSYFEYLILKINEETKRIANNKKEEINELLGKFIWLMRKIFKDESISSKDIILEQSRPVLIIKNVKIYTNYFDEMRQIIFQQNAVEFDDDLSVDMEMAIKAKKEVDKRKNGEGLTFAEQIDKYFAVTHKPRKEIKEMTLRSFIMDFKNQQKLKDFEVFTYPALKTGQNIKHWLASLKNINPYGDLFMSGGQLNNMKNINEDGDFKEGKIDSHKK